MVIKIQGKDYSCKQECKSNCCSEIFLPLSFYQKRTFEEQGFFQANNNYMDYEWLGYHKGVIIEKLDKGNRNISVCKNVIYTMLFNAFSNNYQLHILDKCSKLQPDNKCKVYRSRPEICRKALCPLKDDREVTKFFAEHGLLKEAIQSYRKGELW